MATTLAPRLINSTTKARPIPLVAPVTIVRRPLIARRAIAKQRPRLRRVAEVRWPAAKPRDAVRTSSRLHAADRRAAEAAGRELAPGRHRNFARRFPHEPRDRPAS